jgi:TolA-binding protein
VPPILLPNVPAQWRELAHAGHFAEAWVAAEERGLTRESQSASATDLLLLADCARVAGNHAWERQMLQALRERFPGTPHAAIAAYGIGRVAADARVDYVEADRWFSAALAEQPSGPLAGEAMGRLLELRKLRNDRVSAREVAFEYLARFPEGPYAVLARSFIEEGR